MRLMSGGRGSSLAALRSELGEGGGDWKRSERDWLNYAHIGK